MTTINLYRVTRRETGDSYIGISSNPAKRWKEHERDARCRPQGRFHRALRKYGHGAFDWVVVRSFDTAREAKLAEMCFVYLEQPVYNLTAGGDGTWGYRHTAQSIEKSAAKRRGKSQPHTLELNARKKGVPQTPEHVQKRVSQIRGRKRDPEVVLRVAAKVRGQKRTPEQRERNSAAQQAFQSSLTPDERKQRSAKARAALAAKRAAAKVAA